MKELTCGRENESKGWESISSTWMDQPLLVIK